MNAVLDDRHWLFCPQPAAPPCAGQTICVIFQGLVKQTINQIDKLIEHYTSDNKVNNSQTYIDNKDINPNEIIKTKISLQNRNEQLKDQNITNKETVMLINEANVLIEDGSIISNKMLLLMLGSF